LLLALLLWQLRPLLGERSFCLYLCDALLLKAQLCRCPAARAAPAAVR
jgi:hypothetical protein